jgi:glycosyltransferase involved in cell wall biosynthesis
MSVPPGARAAEAPVRVSVVIPAYNEEGSIARDLDQVKAALAKVAEPWELIVVDDGSTDRTGEIAASMGARVVRHQKNRGTGAARKTGVRAARGEIVVMTDADGTYPNDRIPDLLALFPEADEVIGARLVERGYYPHLRTAVKFLLRVLASWLVGTPIADPNSGLRAVKRDIMLRYIHLIPDGFSSVSSMTLVFMLGGHTVRFVPIDYYRRVGRSKFRPVRDTYWYLLSILRLVAYFQPLDVFMPPALVLMGLGAIKSVVDFAVYRTLQESDIMLVLGGLMLAAVAILADTMAMHRRRDG